MYQFDKSPSLTLRVSAHTNPKRERGFVKMIHYPRWRTWAGCLKRSDARMYQFDKSPSLTLRVSAHTNPKRERGFVKMIHYPRWRTWAGCLTMGREESN